ncbi:MAG: YraN family protein [Bacteroidales bacterium]|nr:YraN family protein [Bacteroidales bacterium]
MSTKRLGNAGERIAVEHLRAKGYTILHTNWRWGHKELDVVAQQGQTLVVVEVKTRQSDYWQEPHEAVRQRKQRHMVEAADAYVGRLEADLDVRFDIISIVWNHGRYAVEHIEDAFGPTLR